MRRISRSVLDNIRFRSKFKCVSSSSPPPPPPPRSKSIVQILYLYEGGQSVSGQSLWVSSMAY